MFWMSNKILLTSFTTWLPHQLSNSSDDLLNEISRLDTFPSLTFLRLLPVDIELASSCVIAKINELQPDVVICCGMAESRTLLTIESTATCGEMVLTTPVNLLELVTNSTAIISDNAGKFVCEGLYYSILKYIIDHKLNIRCIFVHVPILKKQNLAEIVLDFKLIIYKIKYSSKHYINKISKSDFG
jgi:pyroglutamyl-peptidase